MVSSRTPEGLPSHCPLCGAEIALEFSELGGDAPCPSCGTLVMRSAVLLDSLSRICSDVLGVKQGTITADSPWPPGGDSLEAIEVLLQLEERFDLTIPQEDASDIHTVGDLIRYVEQHLRGRDLPGGGCE